MYTGHYNILSMYVCMYVTNDCKLYTGQTSHHNLWTQHDLHVLGQHGILSEVRNQSLKFSSCHLFKSNRILVNADKSAKICRHNQ